MLSKLRYFSKPATLPTAAELHELQSAAVRRLEDTFGSVSLTPMSGGTLGVCYRLEAASGPFFVKTHRGDEVSRENFLKEAEIMTALYGRSIRLEQFDLEVSARTQTFLLMEWLGVPSAPIEPPALQVMVEQYHDALQALQFERATRFATMSDLVDDSLLALSELEQRELISPATTSRLKPYFAAAADAAAHMPPTVCHGDLSNKNIMLSGNNRILIDWEDAFIGFRGYDYLYWLTFMENRKYLSQSVLGFSALNEVGERGVLAMIVAIKSLISARLNSIRPHHLPIETRLLELVQF